MKIKKTLLMGAMLMLSSSAFAQNDVPAQINGYYRLINPGFGDAMVVNNRYNISAKSVSVNDASNVISVKTGKLWSFADEANRLLALYESGQITEEEYSTKFQYAMTVDAWKGGYFPVTSFRCQGVDYVPMIKKLADYCDDAIEAYLNDEIPTIYEKYRNKLTLLCIFASDVITPSNLETVDTFRAWAENYLTRWRAVADFDIYLHAVYSDPVNDTDPLVPTGEYYITFKTPVWVGNMQKAQTYINNMVFEDGTEVDSEKMDLWADSKVRVLRAIAKDYPEGSDAYNFLHDLLGSSEANMQYFIGETEEGKLYIQPLPDTFGSNGVEITADDVARCTWNFTKVDAEQPHAIQLDASLKDADGYYYTTNYTDFAYQLQNANAKAYYATAIDDNGNVTLSEIADSKIPAHTPVIIKSPSTELVDNKLVPLDEEVAAIEGNILRGTFFGMANSKNKKSIAMADGKPAFSAVLDNLAPNTAYAYTGTDAIGNVHFNTTQNDKIYNLQGHMLKHIGQKGIYIVNGKKIIR